MNECANEFILDRKLLVGVLACRMKIYCRNALPEVIVPEMKTAATDKMEQLYTETANIIEQAKKRKGSIKGLCFASSYKNKKKLYALVCQTIKCEFTECRFVLICVTVWPNPILFIGARELN